MVARDLVRQTALKDRQPVAKANDDVASEIFLCLEEQTMRILGRVFRWQGFEFTVDFLNALRRDHAVHVAKAALLNGEQIPVCIAQIDDVVDERHQEVQLRPAPEVICFFRS